MPRLRASWWHFGTALLLLGLLLLSDAMELAHPGQKREDIAAAGAWLDRNVPLDEEILVTSNEMASLAFYHWPQRHFKLYPGRDLSITARNAAAVAEAVPFTSEYRVIYIFGRSWLSDPEGALEHEVVERYASCGGTEVRGIRIYCLRRHS
jgi:hypothetical protein